MSGVGLCTRCVLVCARIGRRASPSCWGSIACMYVYMYCMSVCMYLCMYVCIVCMYVLKEWVVSDMYVCVYMGWDRSSDGLMMG